LRIAFFGSPQWAQPVAEALHQTFGLVLVVTQPDKPAGRGLKLTACPVAQWAVDGGLEVAKPQKLRKNPDFIAYITELQLDVAVTAAYGKILPPELLAIPKYGFLNLHPSDLPKYRGPAPVQWTLIDGEPDTAVCIMQTDAGMDTGPIVAKAVSPVYPHENALELSNRLRTQGTQLLLEALKNLSNNVALTVSPQPEQGTHAPMLTKEDGKIIWENTAVAIYNRHRGVQPWPGSWFTLQKRIKVTAMRIYESGTPGTQNSGTPGTVTALAEGVVVAASAGTIELLGVQPEGKKPMPALDWARGYHIGLGTQLG
jgi:methionyl-tRNA formyltransferase